MPPPKRRRRTLQHGLDGVIARQVKIARENARPRVTQQQLSDMLGVTQATVVRMESGDRAITVAELFAIAAALNVTPEDLLAGAYTEENVPVTRDIKLTPAQARGWLQGVTALPGADEDAFLFENIPRSRARHIYGKLSGQLRAASAVDAAGEEASDAS